MAKSLLSYTIFLALLFCFLLISSYEMQVAEGNVCHRESVEFEGFCLFSEDCTAVCIKEGPYFKGECIRHGLSRDCFCFYNC
ncbi:hypothetical protein RND71_009547 [Anisodus tanguticus]|uniref:Knottins-like domain-containing protein n=1 Tax=Anisodus tanguticus TaxID=243964 RepID=A0AAE1VIA3_9SOLA|nr:hypothetical protein RND71_009547 [Anisodus tanguticus]